MNEYEARIAARQERRANRAERLASLSAALFKRAHSHIDGIPPGQPILVGHHSEARHRRALERHDRDMRKAIELDKLAKEAAYRATHPTNAISSDDPDAPDKLREKLAKLEARQELMRAANKIIKRKAGTLDEKLPELAKLGLSESIARKLFEPDFCGRIGFADYQLTNNNANIRRIKQRVEHLERAATEAPKPDIVGDGFKVSAITEENRLGIFFDSIPPREVRDNLKRAGFKWSPSRGAWVRMLNNAAWHSAKYALKIPEASQENIGTD